MAERTKINKVYIIGTVEEVDTQPRKTNDGTRDYINGKVVIKTIINDVESVLDVKVLAFAKNKDGSDNKMYQSYLKLDGFKGKRVKVSAELRDGNMIDQSTGNVRHFNEIYGKFFNAAKADELDCATFEYSGFVVRGLTERKNKEDVLLGYRLEVAQANYNNTNMSVLRFDVNKDDLNIAQAIESAYTVGSTVKFSGNITYVVTTETKMQEVAFGEPIAKTFTSTSKSFRITGGDEPFGDEDPATYTSAEIKALVQAYKDADAERVANASAAAAEDAAPAVSPVGKAMSNITRSSALI